MRDEGRSGRWQRMGNGMWVGDHISKAQLSHFILNQEGEGYTHRAGELCRFDGCGF